MTAADGLVVGRVFWAMVMGVASVFGAIKVSKAE
jgi:hypothetical protein